MGNIAIFIRFWTFCHYRHLQYFNSTIFVFKSSFHFIEHYVDQKLSIYKELKFKRWYIYFDPSFPAGKIAEKAMWRSVFFLTIWHRISLKRFYSAIE